MKNWISLKLAVASLFFSLDFASAQQEAKTLTPEQMSQDFKILVRGLELYHPSLYRYQDKKTFDKRVKAFNENLKAPKGQAQFLKELAQFTASIKCDHTYTNPWNLDKELRMRLYGGQPYLPLKFRMIEGKMVVIKHLLDYELPKGTYVKSINEIPIATIIDSLQTVGKMDGNTPESKLWALEEWAFDFYFPLFFWSETDEYHVFLQDPTSNENFEFIMKGMEKAERDQALEVKYGDDPVLDELWEFNMIDSKTAYMKMGAFTVWTTNFDYKKFYREAFQKLTEGNIANLIVDLRGNSGGLTDAGADFMRYVYNQPFKYFEKEVVKTNDLTEYDQYIDTWDRSILNMPESLFERDPKTNELLFLGNEAIQPYDLQYEGNIQVLTGSGNKSGSAVLANHLQEKKIAKLVGQPTGGSKEGPTGGVIVYLRLPNTNMEVDLPLIRQYVKLNGVGKFEKDKGVFPDVEVTYTLEDYIEERDPVMEKALELLK